MSHNKIEVTIPAHAQGQISGFSHALYYQFVNFTYSGHAAGLYGQGENIQMRSNGQEVNIPIPLPGTDPKKECKLKVEFVYSKTQPADPSVYTNYPSKAKSVTRKDENTPPVYNIHLQSEDSTDNDDNDSLITISYVIAD